MGAAIEKARDDPNSNWAYNPYFPWKSLDKYITEKWAWDDCREKPTHEYIFNIDNNKHSHKIIIGK